MAMLFLLIASIILAATTGSPDKDTHAADGIALACACVAGVAIFHGMCMGAQVFVDKRCEEEGKQMTNEQRQRWDVLKSAVTAGCQIFWMGKCVDKYQNADCLN